MVFSLTWIPGVLRFAGLKVAEVDGWESRGTGDMNNVAGIICHHTAGPAMGNMPSLATLVNGRSDLRGPLSQLGLGRDGTYYVIAAGRCNHAGGGSWRGVAAGNSRFIGIEAENVGTPADPWPQIQLEAYKRGVAAILGHLGKTSDWCVGHKEYAQPAGRKSDPSFDMAGFRDDVTAILQGRVPPFELIPAVSPSSGAQSSARPTLRRGSTGAFVKQLQSAIGSEVDGYFGPKTEASLRKFQRGRQLVPDGIAGPKTWAVLDEASTPVDA